MLNLQWTPPCTHTRDLHAAPDHMLHSESNLSLTGSCAGAFGVVEQCMYSSQNRMVAVKRLKTDVIKRKADLEVWGEVVRLS